MKNETKRKISFLQGLSNHIGSIEDAMIRALETSVSEPKKEGETASSVLVNKVESMVDTVYENVMQTIKREMKRNDEENRK